MDRELEIWNVISFDLIDFARYTLAFNAHGGGETQTRKFIFLFIFSQIYGNHYAPSFKHPWINFSDFRVFLFLKYIIRQGDHGIMDSLLSFSFVIDILGCSSQEEF